MGWRDRIASTLVHAMQDIRPARESLHDTAQALSKYAVPGSNAVLPIDRMTGGAGISVTDERKVQELMRRMSSPEGYVERLIADDTGGVVEGQHRFDALRQLGARDVPVSRVIDLSRPYDSAAVEDVIRKAGIRHPDQVNQLAGRAFEAAHEYGSPLRALSETELPSPYQGAYAAALQYMGGR